MSRSVRRLPAPSRGGVASPATRAAVFRFQTIALYAPIPRIAWCAGSRAERSEPGAQSPPRFAVRTERRSGAGCEDVQCALPGRHSVGHRDDGTVQFQATASISAAEAAGLVPADIDNNGYQDAVAWTSDSVSVLRAKSDGSFAELLSLGDFKRDPLTMDAVGKNYAAAAQMFDRVGWK